MTFSLIIDDDKHCYYCKGIIKETAWSYDDIGNYVCKDCYDSTVEYRNCGDLIFDEYHKNEEYCSDCL
jgi:hypothetical protein